MNIAIVGFGTEGTLNYDYWNALGAHITICDQDTTIATPPGVKTQLGTDYLHNLDRFDLVVRTAGLNPNLITAVNPGIQHKITTGTNEFLRVCPTRNVIGVTGTKGKGTTSTLITTMLQTAGKQVFLGGNIGIPPFEFLSKLDVDSWVVLELSSFQLYDAQYSPHIAVCLMVFPEHLNWHTNMQDYVHAKTQLFAHQTSDDIAIYFADNDTSRRIAATSPGTKISYYAKPGAYITDDAVTIEDQRICSVRDIKLLGKHNWQNVCAAVTAVWRVTHDLAAIRSVLTTFAGLEHRLELVGEIDRVAYYNDSFGTTPETAIVAIQTFEQPKVVILGGSDKGVPFDALAQVVAQSDVRAAILIGDTADSIESALQEVGFTRTIRGGNTMPDIVRQAQAAAEPGDVILLSTGCASFGMFHNYKDRGEQFRATVGGLSQSA